MSLKYALRLSGKNRLFQMLMVLMLLAVFFMILAGTSIVSYRMRFYAPFRQDLQHMGYCYGAESITYHEGETDMFAKCRKELTDRLENVEDVYATYCWSPTYWEGRRVSCWSYDAQLIEKYTPSLKEGRWLEKSDGESADVFQAVAYAGDYEIHAGDTLTLTEKNYGYSIKIHIVGVLKEDSEVYGYDSQAVKSGTCEDFYVSPGVLAYRGAYAITQQQAVTLGGEVSQSAVFFFDNDAMDRHPYFSETAGGDGTGIQRVMSGMAVIKYRDGISEQTLEKNDELLKGSAYIWKSSLEKVRETSLRFIASQLYVIAPVGVILMVLLLIAVLSYEILSTSQQMKTYAVFFMCGMNWKKCAAISLWHEILLHVAAVVVFAAGYGILRQVWQAGAGLLFLNTSGILLMIGVTGVDILLGVLLPRIMIGKTSPRELFRNQG